MSDGASLQETGSLAALECLLFVAGDPVSTEELARAMGEAPHRVEELLRELQVVLVERGSGLQLARIADGWQLCTRPEYAEITAGLLARPAARLSRAALETLAIVAYRQPITAPEIEAIRGVGVSGVLRTLGDRGLIAESGKRPTPGRPTLYTTTQGFLHYFALPDLAALPPLPPAEAADQTIG
ncbi:MAG TPA: SMC-Scp complex subunit ScpB [Chthonomonadales bacterium]|nr:SMC-Scp complex subunit ScpB [Chthonomonadales bacterium]